MPGGVELKSREEIAHMRDAGRIVAEILDALEKAVAPGVTTWELDQLSERLIHEKGRGRPSRATAAFPPVCAPPSTRKSCTASPRGSGGWRLGTW